MSAEPSGWEVSNDPPALSPPIGKWELIASVERSQYTAGLAATDFGIALGVEGQADGRVPGGTVPASLYFWRPDDAEFRKLMDFPVSDGQEVMLVAIAGWGDTIFLFTQEQSGGTLGVGFRVSRYHVPSGKITKDPVMLDDRADFRVSGGVRTLVANDRVYLFGGCCIDPAIWSYDPAKARLTKETDIPRPEKVHNKFRSQMPAIWDGESILIAPEGDTVLRAFNPTTKRWKETSGVPNFFSGTMFKSGDTLWFIDRSCIAAWNPRGLSQEETGTAPNPDDRVYLRVFDGVEWNGAWYTYSESALTWLPAYLHRWTPPSLTEWPGDVERREC